jgi:hypothetical protein
MALFFDSFKSAECADNFMSAEKAKYNLHALRFDSQEQSDRVDAIPLDLCPPIVLVEQPTIEDCENKVEAEEQIRELVSDFQGDFAGT